MIHLIGVDHRVQYMNLNWRVAQQTKDDWNYYSSVIRQLISTIQPIAVAEELNKEILIGKNHAESILIAAKKDYETITGMKIEHIFAEPDAAWKTATGYKEPEQIKSMLETRMGVEPTIEQVWGHMVAHQHLVREKFWLGSIEKHLGGEIVFVCGDIHLETFPTLLTRRGIQSAVVECHVGVRNLDGPEYRGLKFAQENNLLDQTDCFCLKDSNTL